MAKVVYVDEDELKFDDGSILYSDHNQDCCEKHYLSFSDLSISDFEGLEFDLSSSLFFDKVEDYGIRLHPTNGHDISVPGYGYNNGYYSSELILVLKNNGQLKKFDISDCQVISD